MFKHDLSGDGIILMLSGSKKSDWTPAVAADEFFDLFLVAWSQPSESLTASQIYARYASQNEMILRWKSLSVVINGKSPVYP